MTDRHKVPKRRHLGQVGLEEFTVELPQEGLVLLADMLHCAPMKEDKVEHLCAFADVFVPLGQSPARRLRLHRQVLKEAQKAPIFDVCRLCLH